MRDELLFAFFLARNHGSALACLVETGVEAKHTLVGFENRFHFVIELLTVEIGGMGLVL